MRETAGFRDPVPTIISYIYIYKGTPYIYIHTVTLKCKVYLILGLKMKNSVFSITTKMDKDETKEAKGSIIQ